MDFTPRVGGCALSRKRTWLPYNRSEGRDTGLLVGVTAALAQEKGD